MSGQTLNDIYKYIDGDSRIQMARATLDWSHIAPTAPDTLCKKDAAYLQMLTEFPTLHVLPLGCYPLQGKDPFILTETPHVYFIGNQPRFETRLVQGTTLLCLCSFADNDIS